MYTIYVYIYREILREFILKQARQTDRQTLIFVDLHRFWLIYDEIFATIVIFDDFMFQNPNRRSKKKNPAHGQKIEGF